MLSSCLPSPESDHCSSSYNEEKPAKINAKSRRQEIIQPVLKRSMRVNRNNNYKNGSSTMKNSGNNNNSNAKKGK